jgi:PAS domain S-box-containing protein
MGEPQRIDDARNRHRLADPDYLLSAFIEHCPDRFYVKDAESRFVFASRSVAAGFGLADPSELVGKSDFDFFAAEYAETSFADEQRIMGTREPVLGFEERMIWPDGSVTWDSTTQAPLYDEHGNVVGLFGISRDITDRKLAEERLARQADELARSNAELEHFAYIASHDLQEPLRMVASYTELLARRYRGKLGEDADEFIGYAVDGVNRMRGLINDLLTYSRAGSQPAHEPVDCNAILDHALKNLQAAIADSGAIVAHDTLPTVLGDAGQLAQVFQNLIGNAIKFCGERSPQITVGAARDGDEWLFRIADNGIGIDAEYATRIFLLFQRLHGRDAYPGSGIGLAVCKKIVERNGGRIWFESTPGEGTTFFFSLPAEVQPE